MKEDRHKTTMIKDDPPVVDLTFIYNLVESNRKLGEKVRSLLDILDRQKLEHQHQHQHQHQHLHEDLKKEAIIEEIERLL